jgi:hypothetical protein
MNSKFLLAALIISLLALSTASFASAQTVTPGVSQGDVFEYSYKVNWVSTDSSAQIPSYVTDLNQTTSFQIKINGVSGTTVNAEVTERYRDGTTKTSTGFVNVQSGSIHLTFGYLIIAGNLKINDKIYPDGGDAYINSTSTKAYSSGNRETLNYLIDAKYETSSEQKVFHFDKIKGIAVDYSFTSIDSASGPTETFTETITNTNSYFWAVSQSSASPTPTVPEFSLVLVPAVLIAFSVALLLSKRIKDLKL